MQAAGETIRPSDGTCIAAGCTVGELHLWNEHLPIVRRELGILWAVRMHRRILHSLRLLGERVAADPEWSDVVAFRAEVVFLSRIGRLQMARIAPRYGFDLVDDNPSRSRCIHHFFGNFMIWALDRSLNSHRTRRRRFIRDHYVLWISRRTLLMRYAAFP